MMESTVKLDWIKLVGNTDEIALLTLNRPAASNAFNARMVEEMEAHFATIRGREKTCRGVILRGAGKHFSGGADLEWMRKASQLTEAQNLEEARQLSRLFQGLYRLPFPTMAVVHGAAFGGAVGLVACCDWAIATEDAKFCLSEVKVGVVAAVILPFVSQKIQPGHLRRFVLTGRVFTPDEALASGLVQKVVPTPEVEVAVREEVGQMLSGAPVAQRTFKSMHQGLLEGPPDAWEARQEEMARVISKIRASESGKEGLSAFLDRKVPSWVRSLPADWRLPEA